MVDSGMPFAGLSAEANVGIAAFLQDTHTHYDSFQQLASIMRRDTTNLASSSHPQDSVGNTDWKVRGLDTQRFCR